MGQESQSSTQLSTKWKDAPDYRKPLQSTSGNYDHLKTYVHNLTKRKQQTHSVLVFFS